MRHARGTAELFGDRTPRLNHALDGHVKPRMIEVAMCLLLMSGESEAQERPPRFEDYRVEETAKPAAASLKAPDIKSHPSAALYRTVLNREVEGPPNFAGHFSAVRIGCGSSCAFMAIVDRTTGRVLFPMELGVLSWAGWKSEDYGYTFQSDSRLIRACGTPKESGQPACYYYEWLGTGTRLVAKHVH